MKHLKHHSALSHLIGRPRHRRAHNVVARVSSARFWVNVSMFSVNAVLLVLLVLSHQGYSFSFSAPQKVYCGRDLMHSCQVLSQVEKQPIASVIAAAETIIHNEDSQGYRAETEAFLKALSAYDQSFLVMIDVGIASTSGNAEEMFRSMEIDLRRKARDVLFIIGTADV